MTLAYRDSSFDRPNADQARAAYDAGVRVWGGYVATRPGVGLASSWTQADFAVLQAAGIACVGFCSGWDDAAACGELARSWGVLPMLDCEDGIRGDGPWVPAWLEESGAGLYGLCSVHHHAAPAHIVANYPGVTVPAATWAPGCPAPAGLLGWQAQGSHQDPATGLSVDAGWVDDGFGEDTMNPEQARQLQWLYDNFSAPSEVDPAGNPISTPTQIMYTWSFVRANTAVILSELKQLLADATTTTVGGGLTLDQATKLVEMHDAVLRLEAALKGA